MDYVIINIVSSNLVRLILLLVKMIILIIEWTSLRARFVCGVQVIWHISLCLWRALHNEIAVQCACLPSYGCYYCDDCHFGDGCYYSHAWICMKNCCLLTACSCVYMFVFPRTSHCLWFFNNVGILTISCCWCHGSSIIKNDNVNIVICCVCLFYLWRVYY